MDIYNNIYCAVHIQLLQHLSILCDLMVVIVAIDTDLSKHSPRHISPPADCLNWDTLMAHCWRIQFPDYFVMIVITVCPLGACITFNIVQLRTLTREAKEMSWHFHNGWLEVRESFFFSFIAAVIPAAPSAYKSIISPGKLIIHKLITEGVN